MLARARSMLCVCVCLCVRACVLALCIPVSVFFQWFVRVCVCVRACVCTSLTHALGDVVEEEFPVHLPVGSPEDVTEQVPGRTHVAVDERLEGDAEAEHEDGEDHEEDGQVPHLQQRRSRVCVCGGGG